MMYGTEDENRYTDTSGSTGETVRTTGEYRHRDGYTQRIYSDAHFVPRGENTSPPRYYTPPEPTVRTPKTARRSEPKKKTHRGISVLAAFFMCLSCAIVGGFCGAAIIENQFDNKFSALESRLSDTPTAIGDRSVNAQSGLVGAAPVLNGQSASSFEISPSDIYSMACDQVVGITTDVTYTNFFGNTSSSAVTGSGFFAREDGYIITNYHVIEYAYEFGYDIDVITHDGQRHSAEIVGVEEQNDIALLKIDVTNASAVKVGDSDLLKVGDEVYAVGNPLGELEFSMTFGRLSALDRFISTDETSVPINMFQFDAAVNSGNSGGPVFNQAGEVIGVVTAKYKSTGVEGLGFAIPINDAVSIANELITNGYVTGKATLGISFDERYTSIYSRYYGLPEGAYVRSVERGSCADNAGIAQGDIITKIGDYELSSCDDVGFAVKHYSAGDRTTLSFFRDGEARTVEVVFDEYIPRTVNH